MPNRRAFPARKTPQPLIVMAGAALLLPIAMLLAACGDDGNKAVTVTPPSDAQVQAEPATPPPSDAQQQAEPTPPQPDEAALRAADQDAIETLVRDFFEALIAGDGGAIWAILAAERRAQVTPEQVQRTAESVQNAYRDPGFVFRGFFEIDIQGDRASFVVDAFITEGGVRSGTLEDARNSDPLIAVRDDGVWRLLPDLSVLTMGDLQITVDE